MEPAATMSSRRDKDKGKKEERKAGREAQSGERRELRAAATYGLDGAIAAAAVPSNGTKKIRTPPPSVSPPNKKGPAANSSTSANNSPVFKLRGCDLRVQETASSSSSGSEDSGEDESSVVEAKTITHAGEKLKKRSCVQVESNYFLLKNLKQFAFWYTITGHSCWSQRLLK
jgi:hypothetical protein